jgi:hypothetical protein
MKEFYEDFERIQTVNMELSKAFQSSDAPDYNWVSRGSAEVQKRATRLKHNLMLPSSSKPEERREEINLDGIIEFSNKAKKSADLPSKRQFELNGRSETKTNTPLPARPAIWFNDSGLELDG